MPNIFKSIKDRVLKSKVVPSKIIARFSSFFSEKSIPFLQLFGIIKNCFIKIPIIIAKATEPI
jgi:hypothetical protein